MWRLCRACRGDVQPDTRRSPRVEVDIYRASRAIWLLVGPDLLDPRDDDLDIDANGNFSFDIGPTPDATVLMMREYQADPQTGRPVSWRIEVLDEPDPLRHGDAETAAALRAS